MRFIKDESGQSAIEYILLVGGILVAGIVIFAVYLSMVKTGGSAAENATKNATDYMQREVDEVLKNMS